MSEKKCPICINTATIQSGGYDTDIVRCPRCGTDFILHRSASEALSQTDISEAHRKLFAGISQPQDFITSYLVEVAAKKSNATARSIISHVVRKNFSNKAIINIETLIHILRNNSLPTPAEQANNLVILLADRQENYSTAYDLVENLPEIAALIGIGIESQRNDLKFLCDSLTRQAMLNEVITEGILEDSPKLCARLTFEGWQKYEELKFNTKDSRKAFLAVAFPVENKDKDKPENQDLLYFHEMLYPNHLKQAVAQTKFTLENPLLANPKAGNIHARIEAEIRASKFIIAEITDGNRGAYWEAGFARGLGKPVIYLCKKDITPHFDVGSDLRVMWDNNCPEKAADDLKNVILATVPGDAKMTDNN